MSPSKSQGGFTLIELVIVIVVLGILAAVAVPRYVDLSGQADAAVCDGAVGALTSTAAIQIAVDPIGPKTRSDVIGETSGTGWSATEGTADGVIDVATDNGATCATEDLMALGLTSD